ncbi:uncharacterized protein EDB91DRAFT_1088507 [Suillus paluster]|uniref:uncharacterized protein n=1 Tax=Suillus paluster TaxID=48578 RepID=UPI001B876FC7|nr:uncharacterized protein EDB91DRAFT_1088507 [Suillus paluster]KAG1721240.1 hypothetical protein EDB91DRAFT_1088507 [Suillus paluster]
MRLLQFPLGDVVHPQWNITAVSCFDKAPPVNKPDLCRPLPPKDFITDLWNALPNMLAHRKHSIRCWHYMDVPSPLWVIPLWEQLHCMHTAKKQWIGADVWLHSQVEKGQAACNCRSTLTLALLLSNDWLSEAVVDIMTACLVSWLPKERPDILIMNTSFTDAICSVRNIASYDSLLHKGLRDLEESIKNYRIMYTPIHLHTEEHYVAFSINFETKSFSYAWHPEGPVFVWAVHDEHHRASCSLFYPRHVADLQRAKEKEEKAKWDKAYLKERVERERAEKQAKLEKEKQAELEKERQAEIKTIDDPTATLSGLPYDDDDGMNTDMSYGCTVTHSMSPRHHPPVAIEVDNDEGRLNHNPSPPQKARHIIPVIISLFLQGTLHVVVIDHHLHLNLSTLEDITNGLGATRLLQGLAHTLLIVSHHYVIVSKQLMPNSFLTSVVPSAIATPPSYSITGYPMQVLSLPGPSSTSLQLSLPPPLRSVAGFDRFSGPPSNNNKTRWIIHCKFGISI